MCEFPVKNIINNGLTNQSQEFSKIQNLELILRMEVLHNKNLMLIDSDMYSESNINIDQIIDYFDETAANIIVYCDSDEMKPIQTNKIYVCPSNKRIKTITSDPITDNSQYEYFEKWQYGSYAFSCLRFDSVNYLQEFSMLNMKTLKSFFVWLIECKQIPFYGMKFRTQFPLSGNIGLKEYEKYKQDILEKGKEITKISNRVYARVGIIGNPSDGFYGKTISLSVKNFWSDVFLEESLLIHMCHKNNVTPHESYSSLNHLYASFIKKDYFGELKLVEATCKKFYEYCTKNGIGLELRNFTLSVETNIPLQVGLAGSSAIITGIFKCLMDYYKLNEHDIWKELQPSFVLSVEKEELNILAGLQDRVIQIYEGLIYMDFSKENMEKLGHGIYNHQQINKTLDGNLILPKMFLVYDTKPSDSGVIHSHVSSEYASGNKDIIDGMRQLSELTIKASNIISSKTENETGIYKWEELRQLVNENFSLRRKMYGDEVIGKNNLRMIEIGHKFGAAVKFPGSGGAILGFPGPNSDIAKMTNCYRQEGFEIIDVIPNIPSVSSCKPANVNMIKVQLNF